jgi:hypothetical protein
MSCCWKLCNNCDDCCHCLCPVALPMGFINVYCSVDKLFYKSSHIVGDPPAPYVINQQPVISLIRKVTLSTGTSTSLGAS